MNVLLWMVSEKGHGRKRPETYMNTLQKMIPMSLRTLLEEHYNVVKIWAPEHLTISTQSGDDAKGGQDMVFRNFYYACLTVFVPSVYCSYLATSCKSFICITNRDLIVYWKWARKDDWLLHCLIFGLLCSAPGSKTHESEGKARGSVGRVFVHYSLDCTVHPKPRNGDEFVESYFNTSTL